MISTCPNENTLRLFNDGRIEDDSEIDLITEHLGVCEQCIDKLELMDPCPIVQGLRESASDYAVPDETNQVDELDSIRANVDQAISQASLFPVIPLDPTKLGENRYQMIAAVGQGDFSSVFGALRLVDNKLMGIKIPHNRKLTSFRHSQQFFNDCKLAQSLSHPCIQETTEFGQWDETRIYLAKPLIQHATLTTIAKRKTQLSYATMLRMFRQLAETIQYAHSKEILHRHLNPNNIHVIDQAECDSNPQPEVLISVSDFGFVFDSRYHFDLIEPSESKTPFVSPESVTLNADYIDVRADIYSLGKILKLLVRMSNPTPQDPQLDLLITKATRTRRRDRYQTVEELMDDFDLI